MARPDIQTTAEERSAKTYYVPTDLRTCTHVHVRRGKKQALERPYEGAFEVVERTDKAMVICGNDGATHHVAIDNVKPARLDPEETVIPPVKRKVRRPRKGANQ